MLGRQQLLRLQPQQAAASSPQQALTDAVLSTTTWIAALTLVAATNDRQHSGVIDAPLMCTAIRHCLYKLRQPHAAAVLLRHCGTHFAVPPPTFFYQSLLDGYERVVMSCGTVACAPFREAVESSLPAEGCDRIRWCLDAASRQRNPVSLESTVADDWQTALRTISTPMDAATAVALVRTRASLDGDALYGVALGVWRRFPRDKAVQTEMVKTALLAKTASVWMSAVALCAPNYPTKVYTALLRWHVMGQRPHSALAVFNAAVAEGKADGPMADAALSICTTWHEALGVLTAARVDPSRASMRALLELRLDGYDALRCLMPLMPKVASNMWDLSVLSTKTWHAAMASYATCVAMLKKEERGDGSTSPPSLRELNRLLFFRFTSKGTGSPWEKALQTFSALQNKEQQHQLRMVMYMQSIGGPTELIF
eukprot:PhM_4_TR14635/c0_g1_i1/m.80807